LELGFGAPEAGGARGEFFAYAAKRLRVQYSEKSKGRLPGTREEDARVGSSGVVLGS
jgi:hypothetical protein